MSHDGEEIRQHGEVATGQKRLVWLVCSPSWLVQLCAAGEPALVAQPEIDAAGRIRIPVLVPSTVELPEGCTEIEGAVRTMMIPVALRPLTQPGGKAKA